MGIRSILVNVDVGNAESDAVKYAIDLAKIFEAELIGVAADEPNPAYLGVDAGSAAAEYYASEQAAIEAQLKTSEAQFQAFVPAAIKRSWRGYVAPVTPTLIDCAALADLIVTASRVSTTSKDEEYVDLGELVIGAGRPVIDVATPATAVSLDNIVVGWKDTREARRAVSDALPFLHQAKDVLALTVTEGNLPRERESLADLTAWLRNHGIAARSEIATGKESAGEQLQAAALRQNAGLVVAGGYGHARLREWLFGGATRSLLGAERLNRFFSN